MHTPNSEQAVFPGQISANPALAADGVESMHGRVAERLLILSAVCWTLLVALFVILALYNDRHEQIAIAYEKAVAAFQKDVVYRYWASDQGGIYVPQSDKVPPNPYLTNVVERDLATPSGRKLTLVNPAYMTRMVHALGWEEFGLRAHITSLNPIRPENAADTWETNALRRLAAGQRELYEITPLDSSDHLRFMAPLVTQDRCLKCHAQQGYKVGDLRGGISVSVPLNTFSIAASQRHTQGFIGGLAALWLIGLAGMGWGGTVLRKHRRAQAQAFKAVQTSEEKYRALINNAGEAIFVVQGEKFVFANSSAVQLVGCAPEETIGKSFIDFIHPEDRALVRARYQQRLGGLAVPAGYEFRAISADGKTLYVELNVVLISWQGAPATLNFLRDISERKQTEAKLKERMEELLAWENVTLEREGRISEIKNEVNHLLAELGKPPRYKDLETDPPNLSPEHGNSR